MLQLRWQDEAVPSIAAATLKKPLNVTICMRADVAQGTACLRWMMTCG